MKTAIEIGRALRRARKEARMTQDELAARAGVSAFTIRHAELAQHSPSVATMARIAEALGTSLGALVDGPPAPTPAMAMRIATNMAANLVADLERTLTWAKMTLAELDLVMADVGPETETDLRNQLEHARAQRDHLLGGLSWAEATAENPMPDGDHGDEPEDVLEPVVRAGDERTGSPPGAIVWVRGRKGTCPFCSGESSVVVVDTLETEFESCGRCLTSWRVVESLADDVRAVDPIHGWIDKPAGEGS